ncbi:putative sugar-binding protein [Hydrogenoanaerobacterium saccharovorans]|uniref:Uncharacterized Sugar-binding Domain n=1 Tax=Hydrogenoanaerobacterium saccharovorans TaxID=474960 RepID=A0A1H8EG39_9FIRM|nr:NPCBM/NEW2 domain-containing protein [Hydrogenoanaerobacterium saccharovorans]RPF42067.1 putative sugar-binding protein [Hydrogenoanaerobacterium saccharovorans]SEN18465.1 Uncharacterised Sugar-binding Domain [Hydrogenoanaerobacterium saccharovorans]
MLKKQWVKQKLSLFLAGIIMVTSVLSCTIPVQAAETADVVIDVTDYGADPSGINESTTAVEKAIEYAKTLSEGTPKIIYFPKGEYHFYADYAPVRKLYVSNTVGADQRYTNKRIGILIEDMKNVTIDGGDSLFMYHGDITTFATIRSTNVTFNNFSFDHASPSVVDVTVESKVAGENAIIAYVPECYNYTISGNTINWKGEVGPVTKTPYWQGSGKLAYTQIFDTISGKTWRGSNTLFSNVKSITDLGNNRLKFTYNSGEGPQVGYCFQMRNTTRTTPGTLFWESQNITVKDINAHFLHGFGMVGQLSKDITIDNVDFKARPGTGRTTAGFADFIQMSSIGGKVTIKNCEFSNPHDDPINVHGTFLTVNTVSADKKTFELKYRHNETAGFPQYYVGDIVDFSTKGTMIPVQDSERTVVAVDGPKEGSLDTIRITLDRPVEGITGGNNSFVVENVTYTPEVEIRNNRFIETPTRGVLVSTRKPIVIEDNYFDAMGMSSIFISCDAQGWYESGHTENVIIRNNVFDRPSGSTIYVFPTGSNDPSHQIHSNMLIEDNTFNIESNQTIFDTKSVNGLTIQNNIINRYNPNIELALSADSQTIVAGSSKATTLVSNGTQFNNAVYYFEACKNVQVKNNTYDAGFNQRINLGQYTTAGDIQVEDDDVKIGQNNQKSPVGSIQYMSTNENVATVDANGLVTGKSAGTAEIYAYTVSGARVFESNKITFTVTGTATGENAPTSVEVLSAGNTIDSVNGTMQFSADVKPADKEQSVIWRVRDAYTKNITSVATINNDGLLTASSYGVVEVVATSAADASVYGTKLITITKPKSGKSSLWTVEKDQNSWSVSNDDKLTITAKQGGSWATGSGATNVFLTDIPVGKVDFETTVKLNNKTASDYEEAGIVFFKDHDNYVMVERKHNGGSPKLAVTTETNGSAAEDPRLNDISENVIYLKLVKSGTTFTGYYSTDEINWTKIREVTNNSLGSSFKIGLIATNSPSNTQFTFEDFKVDGNKISFVDANNAPTATDAAIAKVDDATLTVNYKYQDVDNDAEGTSLYRWYIADSTDGVYKLIENATQKTLSILPAYASKYAKAEIVPVDKWGKAGSSIRSSAYQIPARTAIANNANLESLAIAGATLSPEFNADVTAYNVTIPSSVAQLAVSAKSMETSAAVSIQLDGTAIQSGTLFDVPKGKSTLTITVTAPDKTTTKTYSVKINRIANSDAFLESMILNGINGTFEFNKNQMFYNTNVSAEQTALTLSAAASQSTTLVSVIANGKTLTDFTSDSVTELNIPAVAGLNYIEIRTRAEDGITTKYYRISFSRIASPNADLSDLKMDGTSISGFDSAIQTYRIISELKNVSFEAVAADPRAKAVITINGVTSHTADLKAGLNKVVIIVKAENISKVKTYTVNITVPQEDNADLLSLETENLNLSPLFTPETQDYTITTSGSSVLMRAEAVEPNAKISIETDAEIFESGNSISKQINVYTGKNTIKVIVTASNGKTTKTYNIVVNSESSTYLSDMEWESANSGDSSWNSGNPAKDTGWEGYEMSLTGSDGQKVTYQKGIGTHANSTIVYNVAGKGFTRFRSDIGVSYKKNTSSEPHLVFEVLVDDASRYTSKTMLGNTPYETIDLDITNANKVTLKVTQSPNIWSAHGNWADAKFIGTSVEPPERYGVIIEEQPDAIIKTDKKLAAPGEIVTVNVSDINILKLFGSISVKEADDTATDVPVTQVTEDVPEGTWRYRFTMPAEAVKVKVELEQAPTSETPSIDKQPTAQTVTEGNPAVFSITASAADNGTLTYQWQMLTKEQDAVWADISGATNATYQIAKTTLEDSAKQFRCIVTNTKDSMVPTTATSNAAELTVNPSVKKIKSVANPVDITVTFGTHADKLNLPDTVIVTLENDTTAEVDVDWNTESYDGSKAGEYTFVGTLLPQAGIINSDNITAKIKVTVEEQTEQPSKDALLALIASAKEMAKDSKYTQESRDALTEAIKTAQAVADNNKATEQQIADVENALQTAINALEEVQPEKPSKEALLALIASAKEMAEDSKYTQASRDTLNKAIETAQVVADNDNATEQQIAEAEKALQTAIDALVKEQEPEKPSKEALLALIASAKEMAKDSKYTQASRDALTKAIETAQAVADNENATKQEIADAQKALQAAVKALVKQGGSDKPSGGSSEPEHRKHVEPNMVSSSDLTDKVASSSKGTDISVRNDYKVATGFLNELMKNKEKSVTLNGDWYSWTFDGKNVENNMPGVIWFDTRISTDSPNEDAIAKLTGEADTTNLYFSYEGNLPGETVIRVQLEKYAGKPVYVYYHNPEKGRLELIQADVKADNDGWIEFSITHCSDYVVSASAIKGAVKVTKPAPAPKAEPADEPQKEQTTAVNPETGGKDNTLAAVAVETAEKTEQPAVTEQAKVAVAENVEATAPKAEKIIAQADNLEEMNSSIPAVKKDFSYPIVIGGCVLLIAIAFQLIKRKSIHK